MAVGQPGSLCYSTFLGARVFEEGLRPSHLKLIASLTSLLCTTRTDFQRIASCCDRIIEAVAPHWCIVTRRAQRCGEIRYNLGRMAEQDSRPTNEEPAETPEEMPEEADLQLSPTEVRRHQAASPRWLWSVGLVLIALLAGAYWWGSRPTTPSPATLQGSTSASATPTITSTTENTRPPQAVAALTRVAAAQLQRESPTPTDTPIPTLTPTAVAADSAVIVLPTVTPTLVPSPLATRTVEIRGDATLLLQLGNENFQSSGQPVSLALDPRTYILGGETSSIADEWCMQVGPSGLVFDVVFALLPVSGDLRVSGELRLYDGFCGSLGSLGDLLATSPLDVTVPTGAAAQVAPSMQAHANLLGMGDLLNVATGVFLELTIRNPQPR
jgi:hypothetical protein